MTARPAEAEATKTAQDLAGLSPLAAKGDISLQQLDAARATAHSAADRRDAAAQEARHLQRYRSKYSACVGQGNRPRRSTQDFVT